MRQNLPVTGRNLELPKRCQYSFDYLPSKPISRTLILTSLNQWFHLEEEPLGKVNKSPI